MSAPIAEHRTYPAAYQWGIVLLVYVACMFLLWGLLEEDSYIFFRVADNLAHGDGYVFNRGDAPIETGSSPIWQLLLALGAMLPASLYAIAKVLGTAAALLALWQGWQTERLFGQRLPVLLLPFLLGSSITMLFWSQSGMETALFAACVLCWARCLLDPRCHRYIAGAGLLLYVCRPEGFVYLPALLIAWLLIPSCRANFLRHCAVLLASIALFHVLRWWYFDDIFPSAFYAKSAFYPVPHWQLYQNWLLRSGAYWILPLALPALLDRRSLVLVYLLCAACYFAAGNPDGKILFRLGLPAISIACLLAAVGLQQLAQIHYRLEKPILLFALLCVLGWGWRQFTFTELVFFQPQTNPLYQAVQRLRATPTTFLRDTLAMMADPARVATCDHAPITDCADHFAWNPSAGVALWLRDNAFPGMVVAGDQMGEIPWRSGADIAHLDLFGITDRCIGYANFSDNVAKVQGLSYYRAVLETVKRKAICNRNDAIEHVFEVAPDVILLGTAFDTHTDQSFYGRLLADPRFTARYEKRYFVDLLNVVYVKKTLPDFRVPAQVLLVDARNGKILNCPQENTMRRHLLRRFPEMANNPDQLNTVLARCARNQ